MSCSLRYIPCLLTGIVFSVCTSSFAQTSRSDTTQVQQHLELQEVVVTGTGTLHHSDKAPVRTEVITRSQIEALQGRTAEEILSMLSPAFDFSPSDMGSGITLGGFSNKYILILVDGKRLHGDQGGQNDLGKIPTESIRRIEIVKGAASSLYGSDAMAGVINIITNRNQAPFKIENSTRTGSYGDVQQYNQIAFMGSNLSSETSFSFRHSDGWQNTTQEWFKKKVVENSVTKTANRYSNWTVEQLFRYDFNARWSVYAGGEWYGKNMYRPTGNPQWSNFNMRYRTWGARTGLQFAPNDRIQYTLDFAYDLNDYHHVYTTLTQEEYVDEDGNLLHPIYEKGDVSRQSRQQRFTAHLKGVHDLKSHRISAGVEFINDWLDAPYRLRSKHADAYTLAAYAQDEWQVSQSLFLTPGVRFVTHKEFGLDFAPKATLLYRKGPWTLSGTYARGFKVPGIKELYYHYERFMAANMRLYTGNTDLRPEHSNFFSLSADYKQGPFKSSVTLFYNSIKNMIALVEVPREKLDYVRGIDKRMQYKNMEEALSRGADVDFSYRISPRWTLGAAYSFLYADGHFINDDNERVHHMLEGSVKHRGTWRAAWTGKALKLKNGGTYTPGISLFGRAQSQKYSYNYGHADGYMTWRIDSSHRLKFGRQWGITAHAGVDNLFDYKETKPYGLPYASNTPGRTFYVSVAVNFNQWK